MLRYVGTSCVSERTQVLERQKLVPYGAVDKVALVLLSVLAVSCISVIYSLQNRSRARPLAMVHLKNDGR